MHVDVCDNLIFRYYNGMTCTIIKWLNTMWLIKSLWHIYQLNWMDLMFNINVYVEL